MNNVSTIYIQQLSFLKLLSESVRQQVAALHLKYLKSLFAHGMHLTVFFRANEKILRPHLAHFDKMQPWKIKTEILILNLEN